jgi:hypothetical protein
MALGHSIFVPLAEFLSKSCTNLEFLIEPSVCRTRNEAIKGQARLPLFTELPRRDVLRSPDA